ncbi:MAG: hypothetical protein PHF60_03820 [Candidatus ainarchaeum sp.]|nr:hypothetical protein [Candidatus ainarchaeum sp.]
MTHTGKLAFSTASADRQSATTQSSSMKRLKPLNETINGLPVYGTDDGRKFTVRTARYEKCVDTPAYFVEIKAVNDSGNPQVVSSSVLGDHSTLFIDRIRHVGSDESPHENGLFMLILKELQIIAAETGRKFVSILPENDQAKARCAAYGFQNDEARPTGHMRLQVVDF